MKSQDFELSQASCFVFVQFYFCYFGNDFFSELFCFLIACFQIFYFFYILPA